MIFFYGKFVIIKSQTLMNITFRWKKKVCYYSLFSHLYWKINKHGKSLVVFHLEKCLVFLFFFVFFYFHLVSFFIFRFSFFFFFFFLFTCFGFVLILSCISYVGDCTVYGGNFGPFENYFQIMLRATVWEMCRSVAVLS
jgi:hypothetical protein